MCAQPLLHSTHQTIRFIQHNTAKSTNVMHTLLYLTHQTTDLILIQEPWIDLTIWAIPKLPSPIPPLTPSSPPPHPIYDGVWLHFFPRVRHIFPLLPDMTLPIILIFNALPLLPYANIEDNHSPKIRFLKFLNNPTTNWHQIFAAPSLVLPLTPI